MCVSGKQLQASFGSHRVWTNRELPFHDFIRFEFTRVEYRVSTPHEANTPLSSCCKRWKWSVFLSKVQQSWRASGFRKTTRTGYQPFDLSRIVKSGAKKIRDSKDLGNLLMSSKQAARSDSRFPRSAFTCGTRTNCVLWSLRMRVAS